MQMGNVVGFNEYRNYRLGSEIVLPQINSNKEVMGQNISGKNNHNDVAGAKKLKRKKIQLIKNAIMKIAVVAMFFVIVFAGAFMLRYIVRHSKGILSYESSADMSYDDSKKIRMAGISFGGNSFDRQNSSVGGHEDDDWNLRVVNKSNPVPDDYDIELTTLSNGVQVDSRIYPDLQNMFDDMRAEGVYPVVGEGFRTRERQAELMQQKIDAYRAEGHSKIVAKQLAKKWVAKPGTSEHELGIALDINAAQDMGSTNEDVYEWLYNNAYKYGFILRYPQGKEDVTGIDYEPWHYRYVGKNAAKEIYESGMTLEEYVK